MNNRTPRLYVDICLVVLFVMLILLGLIFSLSIPSGIVYPVDVDYEKGWYYEDGTACDVLDLDRSPGTHRISRTITAQDIMGASLCCDTSNLLFDVYLDSMKIYSFHPDLPEFYGNYYGSFPHFISIPQFEGTKKLTIEYESLFDDPWTAFRNMKLTEAADYYQAILRNYLGRFMQCFLIILAGLTMVLCGFIFDKDKERFTSSVSLGVVSVILACYSNSGSLLIQAVTHNSATPRIIELMSLMLLPIPTIIYMGAFTGNLRKWYVKLIIGLATANTIISFIIVRLTDLDFHDLLICSHVTILLGLVFCFYMIFDIIRKKGMRKGTVLLVISVAVVFIAGIIDLMRYYFSNSSDTAMFTRYGLVVLIILMGYNEIRELIKVGENSIKTEIMAKVAYTDALTGIPNREAFYVFEKELLAQKKGYKCQIIQLDLNYLKKANDEFGHQEGDKLIIAAARAINDSFGVFGQCFRTGGDEFTVAVENSKYDKAVEEFNRQVEIRNNDGVLDLRVELSIAYGAAEFIAGTSDLEEVEAVADGRMYKMKKQMKAERKE